MFKYLLKKHSINIEIFSLALCIFIAYKLTMLCLRKLEVQSIKNNRWSLALFFNALQIPFKWCFGMLIIALILEFTNSYFHIIHIFSTTTLQRSIIVLFVTWVIIHFCNIVREHVIKNSHIHFDKTATIASTQIGTVITVIIGIIVELQILGVNIAGILAFGGLSGIAVGFASKDLLANFFGAMMIYTDKPFKVGDWIRSPEKAIEGEVESIGWRQTKIMTFEKRPIYVPNSVFSTVVVENPSRMTHRRIEEIILIKHEDHHKVKKISEDIQNFLINHHDIDNSQTLYVSLHAISPFALELKIYCYTAILNSATFAKFKEDILLQIAKIIENNEAHFVETSFTQKSPNNNL